MSNNAQHVYFLQKKKAEILARKSREKAGGFEPSALLNIANDGSFLERFNKMMQQQQEQKQQHPAQGSQRKEQQKGVSKSQVSLSSPSASVHAFKSFTGKLTELELKYQEEPELKSPEHTFVIKQEDEVDGFPKTEYDLAKDLAQKVAAEGEETEEKMKIKHRGDSRYQFLFHPHSRVAEYYQLMLRQYKQNPKRVSRFDHITTNGAPKLFSETKKRKRNDDSVTSTTSDKTKSSDDSSKRPVPGIIQRFSVGELAKLIHINKGSCSNKKESSKYEKESSKVENEKEKLGEHTSSPCPTRGEGKKEKLGEEPCLSSKPKVANRKTRWDRGGATTTCTSTIEIKKGNITGSPDTTRVQNQDRYSSLNENLKLATQNAEKMVQEEPNQGSKQARKMARQGERKKLEEQAEKELVDSEKETMDQESAKKCSAVKVSNSTENVDFKATMNTATACMPDNRSDKKCSAVKVSNSEENVDFKATVNTPTACMPDNKSPPADKISNDTIEVKPTYINVNTDKLLNNVGRNSKCIELTDSNDISDDEPMYTVDETSECCELALLELIPQVRDPGKDDDYVPSPILELASERILVYSVYSRSYRAKSNYKLI